MNAVHGTPRILLLEEDYESMKGLKDHLEEEGWQAELTARKSILSRLSEERFDLILLDLMIHPESKTEDQKVVENIHFANADWQKTGVEFLRRLRSGEFSKKGAGTQPDVPVIVLSAIANTTIEDESDIVKMANHYIEKPFRLNELMKKIRELVGENHESTTHG